MLYKNLDITNYKNIQDKYLETYKVCSSGRDNLWVNMQTMELSMCHRHTQKIKVESVDELVDTFKVPLFRDNIIHVPDRCTFCSGMAGPIFEKEEEKFTFHIRLGDACNARCRYCFNGETLKPFDPNENFDIAKILKTVREQPIKTLKIQGGETFLFEKEIVAILEEAKNNDTIHDIIFTTNCTIYNKNIMEAIGDIKESGKVTTLVASIDGHDALNAYLRPGCNYDICVDNILKYFPFFSDFRVSVVVTALSALDLSETIERISEDIWFTKPVITARPAFKPGSYSIANLPDNLKEDVLKEIDKIATHHFIKSGSVRMLLDELSVSGEVEPMISEIIKKDKMHNTSYKDVLNKKFVDFVDRQIGV